MKRVRLLSAAAVLLCAIAVVLVMFASRRGPRVVIQEQASREEEFCSDYVRQLRELAIQLSEGAEPLRARAAIELDALTRRNVLTLCAFTNADELAALKETEGHCWSDANYECLSRFAIWVRLYVPPPRPRRR